ncbi:putative histone-lysine N-methyltransferase [Helianthus annuus]|nr:putative histone-lysine N-methyltransferase [Helianthus annuus]
MTTHKKDSKTSAPRAPDLNEQKQKVEKAYSAMADLGISTEVVKPVLKNLLKLYDGNWELIEEDKYRTLADAIFESLDDKVYLSLKLHGIINELLFSFFITWVTILS